MQEGTLMFIEKRPLARRRLAVEERFGPQTALAAPSHSQENIDSRPARLREPRFLRHAFVFLPLTGASTDTPADPAQTPLSAAAVHEAKSLAQIFSDRIRRPGLGVFHASLADTFPYFRTLDRLHETVARHLAKTPLSLRPTIVLCSSFLRGFLYAHHHSENSGLLIANHDNLSFRRFKEGLSWDAWLAGTLGFLHLLDLKKSERELNERQLKDFCERMRLMRFAKPAAMPESLRGVSLHRRFGAFTQALWEEWLSDKDASPLFEARLRNLPESLHAGDFKTSVDQTSSYEGAISIPAAEIENAFLETFYTTLNKLASHASLVVRHGLRDVRLEITFNGGIHVSQIIRLNTAVYEKSKHGDLILAHALQGLPQAASEVRSPVDPSLFVTILFIENLEITPVHVTIQNRAQETLFFGAESGQEQALAHKKKILEVKDTARVAMTSLSTRFGADACYFKLSEENSNQGTAPFTLFRYLYAQRPLAQLSTPVNIHLEDVLHRYGFSTLQYCESVGDEDYYILFLRLKSFGLWLAHSCSLRAIPPEKRDYRLMGVFDSDYEPFEV